MLVLMVDVRVVFVRMLQLRVAVGVHMRLCAVPAGVVRVLMVRIVTMGMGVIHRFMRMRVLMALGQMQPDTGRHQQRSRPEQAAGLFAK